MNPELPPSVFDSSVEGILDIFGALVAQLYHFVYRVWDFVNIFN